MALEERLRAGLADLGVDVSLGAQVELLRFQELLLHWNRSINLTAITDPLEMLEKHLLDSLTLLTCIEDGDRLLDFGSGAGVPGLPVKIARPAVEVWSVEAVRKKINFQKHVVRELGLRGFYPRHARIEAFARSDEAVGGFSLITARAVAELDTLVKLAVPMLAGDGRLVVMKGPEAERELAAAGDTLQRHGLACGELRQLRLPVSGSERTLMIIRSV